MSNEDEENKTKNLTPKELKEKIKSFAAEYEERSEERRVGKECTG